ncbi:MAG: Bifunctional transcriptional activator/DNA repair enzyme AdaA [Lentisphaerae bacterium ADurb.Bin242]|nr:MAG: Bifunctional transcriptional activator/DNA repair enzyme AdaA [Lentisphaerae bacterium ADurb.Bin242]
MIISKHLSLAQVPRAVNFPYCVQSIGYARNNPELKNWHSVFPDKIEICLRMLPSAAIPEDAEMRLGETDYRLPFPHALVKLPCQKYIYKHLCVREVFYFTYASSLYGHFEELGLFSPPFAWRISLTPEVNNLISRLHDYLNVSGNFGYIDRIDALCFQLLMEILIMKQKEQTPPDSDRERIMQADSFMRLHFAENISLEDLAEINGFSRTSFFRIWTRYFHIPPARHLQEIRLQEACRLLTESRLKVCQVARAVNIKDPAYFCAVFQKKFRMTPVEYRKSHVPGSNPFP